MSTDISFHSIADSKLVRLKLDNIDVRVLSCHGLFYSFVGLFNYGVYCLRSQTSRSPRIVLLVLLKL